MCCLNLLCIYFVHDDAYKQSAIEKEDCSGFDFLAGQIITYMLSILTHDGVYCVVSLNNLDKRNMKVHNLPYLPGIF